jgi:hypothetical protein
MNTEDDEFNRIERESKARMMSVQYALDKSQVVIPLPISKEDLDKVLKENVLQKLYDENVRLGLYDDSYGIPFVDQDQLKTLLKPRHEKK